MNKTLTGDPNPQKESTSVSNQVLFFFFSEGAVGFSEILKDSGGSW